MKQLILFLSTIIVIVAVGTYLNKRRENKFLANSCYTTAINPRVTNDSKGNKVVLYSINVDNKAYSCVYYFREDKEISLPAEVKVRYVCNEPDVNEIVFE
ncbi:MAG TPA: hypothetical protein VHO72_11200 [Bacteroidales bacterium]|nr:hypothetical protein [Bacteroidales bacterium]